MSNVKPMGIAYPPRPLAEPRSGRYAGCKSAAGEVFGCIPHGRGACRESDSFARWAVHHGVTVSMTTVSISSDPFIPFIPLTLLFRGNLLWQPSLLFSPMGADHMEAPL